MKITITGALLCSALLLGYASPPYAKSPNAPTIAAAAATEEPTFCPALVTPSPVASDHAWSEGPSDLAPAGLFASPIASNGATTCLSARDDVPTIADAATPIAHWLLWLCGLFAFGIAGYLHRTDRFRWRPTADVRPHPAEIPHRQQLIGARATKHLLAALRFLGASLLRGRAPLYLYEFDERLRLARERAGRLDNGPP